MALWQKVQHHLLKDVNCSFTFMRLYSSKVDWTKIRPLVHEKLRHREKSYRAQRLVSEAYSILNAREVLVEGLSTLLNAIPIKSCKFCPEIYVGDTGHKIKTCHGFKRMVKNQVHQWTEGNLNDILVPLEAYHHQNKIQEVDEHHHGLPARLPAIVELCHQAGVKITTKISNHHNKITESNKVGRADTATGLPEELIPLAQRTLGAWETLRLGLEKLLLACPAKVCSYCSEVHIGPSEYRDSLHEIFKKPKCPRHHWKKAGVDDFVPPKVVWHRRPHDPPVLVDSGRDFYGRAPAVVVLCVQAGARVPAKYSCTMKSLGLTNR